MVVKYLNDRYFEESEEKSYMDDTMRGNIGRRKHPDNIEDNINLLKRLVDRQTKQLAELNKKVDSIVIK